MTAHCYRWLSASEAKALGLGEQVANLVQDQNRLGGHADWSADEWADWLWKLSESPETSRLQASAFRQAVKAMRVHEAAPERPATGR